MRPYLGIFRSLFEHAIFEQSKIELLGGNAGRSFAQSRPQRRIGRELRDACGER